MKKFLILYSDYGSDEIKKMEVTAECSQDAINYFFDVQGGQFLRCEFIDWA